MATYKVLSERFTLANKGETVDDKALEGANIQALIDGGHIALVISKKTDETEGKDK